VTFRLPDRWVWDLWTAHEGGRHHLFFLYAPRSLGDPLFRHHNARIGHAVSTDLRSWEVLEDPFPPGPSGAWDDLATWTGSVIEHAGHWYMFYTGVSSVERGLVQRIGLATSPDLVRWEKYDSRPLIVADPAWYELLDSEAWHSHAWRDPWVFRDDRTGTFHAVLTARRRTGSPDGRGVLGHAVSTDLIEWEVLPPIETPRGFGQLEVPQVVPYDGSASLLFCTDAQHLSHARRESGIRIPSGTYVVPGADILGPFSVAEATPMLPFTQLYAGRVVEHAGGHWLLGFVDIVDGRFVGEIADPIPFDPATATSIVEPGDGRPDTTSVGT
jgi:beta-fructofuranosidase